MTSTFIETCRQCGDDFEARLERATYCTNACRARATRERQAALSSLAIRQTQAAVRGDRAELDRLTAEALRLLGF